MHSIYQPSTTISLFWDNGANESRKMTIILSGAITVMRIMVKNVPVLVSIMLNNGPGISCPFPGCWLWESGMRLKGPLKQMLGNAVRQALSLKAISVSSAAGYWRPRAESCQAVLGNSSWKRLIEVYLHGMGSTRAAGDSPFQEDGCLRWVFSLKMVQTASVVISVNATW